MTFATNHILAPIAGSVDGDSGLVDGDGQTARFHQPLDIAINEADTYAYVADYGNFAVRRVDLDTGETTTLTDNLPGSPVRLVVSSEMIFVSCIAPINPDWLPPVPYTEAEITELQLATPSYDVVDTHIQAEFDAGARYPASPGDLTNVPSSLNVHPGARQMLCFWPNGDLCWMRQHGSLGYTDETYFEAGIDGAFILSLGDGIIDYGAQTGYIPGWKIRSNNSGQTYGADPIFNIKPRFGTMPGISGYMDATYVRPEASRNHCYCGAGSQGCGCYPAGWPDHDYHVHTPAGVWTCDRWGSPHLGDWDSGTVYNSGEVVSKPGDPDTYYWYGYPYASPIGLDPSDPPIDGEWVLSSPSFTPDAWDSLTSYSDGAFVTFGGFEYMWEGTHRTSTAGYEPGVHLDTQGVWNKECRCAVLPKDLHYSSGAADLTHSYWQDMSADQDWCDAYNNGSRWVPYQTMDWSCIEVTGFSEPGVKSSTCGETADDPRSPCWPDLCMECPGMNVYNEGNNDWDGAYGSDTGLLMSPHAGLGYHVGFLSYVYPSHSGLTTQHGPTNNKCECVDPIDYPMYVLKASYTHWGETLSDSVVDYDRQFLTRTWGTDNREGWQMAWGPMVELATPMYDQVIGTALYNSPLGFLQTFEYAHDGLDVSNATFWGEIDPPYNVTGANNANGFPVRGCAYSTSRQTWYFTTSATSTYGPYTKNVDGSRNDIGYHQVVRMIPYVEVHPTGTMNLGGLTATFDQGTLYTTVSGFVWNDLNRDGLYSPGEPLLAGIDLISYDGDMNVRDTATTDINGEFSLEAAYPHARIEIDSASWPDGLTEQIPPYRIVVVDGLVDNEANFSLREPRVSDIMPSAGNFIPMHVA